MWFHFVLEFFSILRVGLQLVAEASLAEYLLLVVLVAVEIELRIAGLALEAAFVPLLKKKGKRLILNQLVNGHQNDCRWLTRLAAAIFSAAYTVLPHLAHFSPPPPNFGGIFFFIVKSFINLNQFNYTELFRTRF